MYGKPIAGKRYRTKTGTKPRVYKKATVPPNLAFQKNTVGAGPEKKDSTSNATTATMAAGGWAIPAVATLINGIAQGATETTRVGRKVTMKSILINWTYVPLAALSGTANPRLTVIYDKQPSGVYPLITDIFHVNNHLSPMLLANSDRFSVLHNEILQNPNVNIAATTVAQMTGVMYIKCNLEAIFSGAGGLIANINSGALYFLSVDDTGLNSAVTYISRVRFVDQ